MSNKFAFIIISLLIVVCVFYSMAYTSSVKTINITIIDKERITTGSGETISSQFIIYTDNEVFENTDSWLYLKFNSADFQNKLQINETYRVRVAGWRIPFFSSYRNIIHYSKY